MLNATVTKPTKNPSRWVPLETQDMTAAFARSSAPTAAPVVDVSITGRVRSCVDARNRRGGVLTKNR